MMKVPAADGWQLAVVLHRHDASRSKRFAETRTDRDHVEGTFPIWAGLEMWQAQASS